MRLALLIALVALSGCAATRTVPPSSLAATQARLDGKRVTVVTADGTAWRGDALRLAPDSTSWFDAQTGAMRAVPTASVVRIEHRAHGRHALRGALAGLAVGAATGMLLATSAGSGNQSLVFRDPTKLALAGALVLAPVGAITGGLGGAIRSKPDRYLLPRAATPR